MNKLAKISLCSVFIFLVIILLAIPFLKSDNPEPESVLWSRTPTTETLKNPDGTYTKTLYSGIMWVDEGHKRYPYFDTSPENASSLKGKGFEIVYIENDSDYKLDVIDFNYTTITYNLTLKSTGSVPIKVWEINETKQNDPATIKNSYKDYSDVKSSISPTQSKTQATYTSEIGTNKILEIGSSSTTITLQDADTENLEDTYISLVTPDTSKGDSIALYPHGDRRAFFKFYSSELTSSFVYNITNAELNLTPTGYAVGNYAGFLYNVSNQTWSEDSVTWNNRPTNGSLIDTNLLFGDSGVKSFSVTDWVKNQSAQNISFMLHSNSTTISIASKENGVTADRPKLTITYTPYIDIISPTPSEILTDDTPKPNFNISNATVFDVCYWTNDSGATNYSMTNSGNYWYNDTENILFDGSHTVSFYCNQSDDGTWRTSDSVSFDIDSVNITVCRDLTVASRTYYLLNDISSTSSDCISIKNISVGFNGNDNEITVSGGDYTGILINGEDYDYFNITNITVIKTCSFPGENAVDIINADYGTISNFNITEKSNNPNCDAISVSGSGTNFTLGYVYRGSNSDDIDTSNSHNFRDVEISDRVNIDSGTVNFINVTSRSTMVESVSGNLNRKWYFQTQINDSSGYLANAQVDIYDKDDNLEVSLLTNSTGQIARQELIEYVNNGGVKTFNTPHTVNISKATYTTNSTTYNLTTETNVNHVVVLSLSNVAPTSTLSTPTNNQWSNSLTNTMTCNQSDTNGNLKNVTIYTWLSGVQETKNTKTVLGSTNSTKWTNLGFTSQGTYKWNCYVCDNLSACVWATSNFTLNIDAINPVISIKYPINTTNTTNTGLDVNYTATDTNLDKCWYSNNSGTTNKTLTSCANITSTTWSDGVWNITIWANDSASRMDRDTIRFTIDTTAPVLTILTPSNTTNSTNTGLDVNYTATDTNLHSCWYSNDSGVSNITLASCANITSTTWADGIWNITIWANDSAGTENHKSVRFTIDTTYPLISFETATENNNTNFSRNWIYSNITFTEINLKNITFRLYTSAGLNKSNNYLVPTYSQNWTSLNDGIYYYNVTINDYAVNSNYTETRKITIDDTPPTISITYPIHLDSYNNGTNFWINYTISDNLIGTDSCWYTNDSGTNNFSITCGQNFTQNLSDGEITYIVYSNDSLGNIGSDTVTFTISSVVPSISLKYPTANLWINNGTARYINFTATDTDGIDDCQLWGNWSGWHLNYTWESIASGVMNWTQVNLSDGNYIYNVWCNDTLDNQGFATNNRTFHIDTTYPLIAFDTATEADNTNFSRNWIYANVTFTETNFNNITFHLLNDTGAVNTTTYTGLIYSINWTDLIDNNYTYYVNITDKANNHNFTEIRTITIDDTNPNAILIFPGNATYNSTLSQNFTSNLTDNLGIQNATLYVYNETGEYNKTSETFSPNLIEKSFGIVITLIDGIYHWWVNLFDWAGNSYQTENNTVTIDSIPPEVTNQSYSPTIVYNTLDVTIFGNISDTNLDMVWLQINHSGTYTNTTITDKLGNQYNYTLSNALISNHENISWFWWANDSAGNSNVSSVDFFITTNRNPLVVTISNPANLTYFNTNWFYVNFSSTDADSDTLNYSIFYSDNNTDYVISNWTNTLSYSNITGFNTSEGAINYFRVNVSDGYLDNISDIYTFYIDTINPSVNLSYPEAPLAYQCSMTNIGLNYSVSDTNLDYCEFNVTFVGSTSTVNTRIATCVNTTFNVSYDNSVQTLTFIAVDYAGNINKTTRLIYIDTDNAGCPTTPVTPPGGGGGAPPVEPPLDLGYCGDSICQDGKDNRTSRGETFYNCPEDCAITIGFGDINFDTLLLNCFDGDSETACVWETSPGLLFGFIFIGGILLFTILFQFSPKRKGIKKFVYSPSFRKKRRRRY